MYNQLLFITYISFSLIKTTLLDMTLNNPLFIFAIITVVWFTPGILVRRYNEIKKTNKKVERQADAIRKLYPKGRE